MRVRVQDQEGRVPDLQWRELLGGPVPADAFLLHQHRLLPLPQGHNTHHSALPLYLFLILFISIYYFTFENLIIGLFIKI